MKMEKTVILGAGIAGLGAAYACRRKGGNPTVLEKDGTFGGLKCTSGYHISVALKTKDIPPYLWWYIYDEDILAARVYSPSLKSPENAPEGCSSLQMEVYCREGEYAERRLLDGTVGKLAEMGVIRPEDILFTMTGFEKYANVVFDHGVRENRSIVKGYLKSLGIIPIGRFGEWDYLWSDQSLISGMNAVNLTH